MRSDLKVGAQLPDLELPDHDGRPTRLSGIAKGFPLIVTFYRGWW
jgi:peroxiredoxin